MLALTADTKFKITAGGAVVAFAAAFGFGVKFQATLSQINQSLKDTVHRLDSVEAKLTERIDGFEVTMADRWTKAQSAEWALRMLVVNPSIKIPDPREPSRLLGSP